MSTVSAAVHYRRWSPRATEVLLRLDRSGIYLAMGWSTIPFLPAVVANRGWDTAGLLLAGGALYTVGAVIVAVQRPDARPAVSGYHEVWHLLVVGAVVRHDAMVGATLLPLAGSGDLRTAAGGYAGRLSRSRPTARTTTCPRS